MNRDVQLEIEGSLLERLIAQAMARGATFARLRRTGARRICVLCDEGSAEVLLSLCRRYGLNCRVLRRGGKPELIRRMRVRWTLLLGVLLCCLICALFLSRLWIIDVSFTGPRADLGDAEAIRAFLEAEGVSAGMLRGGVDADILQKRIMAGAGEYSYVGVRLQGVRLHVEAAPEVPSPELYRREYARDIVAARDGVVMAVNAKSGTPCVKPGDTVRRGQTLIRGEEAMAKDAETGEEIMTPVAALGEVIARSWYEGSAVGSLETDVTRRTGRTGREAELRMLGFSLPMLEGESFAQEEVEEEILPVVGLFLPLEILRSTHYETAAERLRLDPAQLEEKLLPVAQAEARMKIAGDGISAAPSAGWTDSLLTDSILHVRAVYEITGDIATTRDTF